MPYKKGLARVMADMKHEWGLWPLMGALAVGGGVLATGIWHNIVKGEGLNWKAGSAEKKKHLSCRENNARWLRMYLATDGKGINRKFHSASEEYGKRNGGNHDWSAPKKNLSQE